MSAGPALPSREIVPDFEAFGVTAFTTTRDAGDFSLSGDAAVGDVLARWTALREAVGVPRLASAHQVHGTRVLRHGDGWSGWLRDAGADGHVTTTVQTALAVSVANQARALGVREISASSLCTRCDGARLFSHRAGDRERQVGVACVLPR